MLNSKFFVPPKKNDGEQIYNEQKVDHGCKSSELYGDFECLSHLILVFFDQKIVFFSVTTRTIISNVIFKK